jgi:hypothetical protein
VTVHVSATTVIQVTDASGTHTATLADLATGMKAEADYDPVSLVADHIKARAAHAEQAEVEGTITAVDATAATVTIHPGHGADVVLHTDSTTRISRNGAPATLADLHAGDSAEARYDTATLLASRLEARSEHPQPNAQVEGIVTAVTADSVTITPQSHAPVTLTIDATTQIFLRGTPSTLAAIQVGQRAHAAYASATLIAAVLRIQQEDPPANAEVHGRITAVSATSITIAPEHGSPVTLVIDATTQIFLRHHATGTAADLHTGDRVEAQYASATLLAKRIQVDD